MKVSLQNHLFNRSAARSSPTKWSSDQSDLNRFLNSIFSKFGFDIQSDCRTINLLADDLKLIFPLHFVRNQNVWWLWLLYVQSLNFNVLQWSYSNRTSNFSDWWFQITSNHQSALRPVRDAQSATGSVVRVKIVGAIRIPEFRHWSTFHSVLFGQRPLGSVRFYWRSSSRIFIGIYTRNFGRESSLRVFVENLHWGYSLKIAVIDFVQSIGRIKVEWLHWSPSNFSSHWRS